MSNGEWLVLVMHQENSKGAYSTTSDMLEGLLQYITQNHLHTATISQALEEAIPQKP